MSLKERYIHIKISVFKSNMIINKKRTPGNINLEQKCKSKRQFKGVRYAIN